MVALELENPSGDKTPENLIYSLKMKMQQIDA